MAATRHDGGFRPRDGAGELRHARRSAASPRGGKPDDPAYIELSDRGQEVARLTFAELAGRAAALARRIADRAGPGDRALLLCPNGIGFMVGFFACVLARVAAVPMMVPRRNSARDASAGIVADCTPRLALAPRALIDGERGDLAARFANAGRDGSVSNFWRWTTPKPARRARRSTAAASPARTTSRFCNTPRARPRRRRA